MPAGPENSGYLLFLSYQTYQSNSKHAILKHRFHSLPQLPRSSLQPAVSGALGHWAHWMRTGQPGALVNMNQKTNRMVYVGICWNVQQQHWVGIICYWPTFHCFFGAVYLTHSILCKNPGWDRWVRDLSYWFPLEKMRRSHSRPCKIWESETDNDPLALISRCALSNMKKTDWTHWFQSFLTSPIPFLYPGLWSISTVGYIS